MSKKKKKYVSKNQKRQNIVTKNVKKKKILLILDFQDFPYKNYILMKILIKLTSIHI